MGRNGIRKRIYRLADGQDDEFLSSKRTYTNEILSGDQAEENAYQDMDRNDIRKRINRLADGHDSELFMSSKRTYANEILSADHTEDNAYQGNMDKLTFNCHYGGYFIFSPSRKYVCGKLKKIDFDVDYIAYFDILDELKNHCKFNVMEGDRLYYLRGDRTTSDYDGLIECCDDSDVMNILSSYKTKQAKPIEIYTLSEDHHDTFMNTSLKENSLGNNMSEELSGHVEGHESSDGQDINLTGSEVKKRKTRGPTRCVKIINLKEGEKLAIEFNEDDQPIGNNATQFVWFLGQLVRNRACCPLKVSVWKDIEKIKIDTMWDIILEKFTFDVSESRKEAILGHMSDLYRGYRHKLKKKFFDSKSTYQLRLRNKPKKVQPDEWKYLVNLWSSAEYQERSMQNKTNRSKRSLPPYIGTKSYARLKHEMTMRDGVAPSRVDLFKESRKRKKGKEVDAFQQDVIVQFDDLKKQQKDGEISLNDDDIFAKVLGPEKNGYLRAYGPGKSISGYFGGRPSKVELVKQVEAARKEATERMEAAKREANERVEEVKRESREQMEEMRIDMDNKLAECDRRWEERFRRLCAAQGQNPDMLLRLMDEP